MREIKLRAWIPSAKTMVTDGLVITTTEYGIGSVGIDQQLQEGEALKGLVWSEYTGRKDKNSREIYEGDILQCNSSDDEWTDHVVYKGSGFHLSRWNNKYSHIYPDFEDILKDCIVIGNIYEKK